MSADGKIRIEIDLDASKLDDALDKIGSTDTSQAAEDALEGVSRAAEEAAEAMAKTGRQAGEAGDKMDDAGKQASKASKEFISAKDRAELLEKGLQRITKTIIAGATAMAGLATAAIKVGMDFEAGMSKVEALSGATGDELEALTEKAKELGASTKFSATEAAKAMEYMAQAGWRTADMLDGMDGVITLAIASGEELALVSNIITDSLTAFGLAAADTAHFADVLAVAANATNTDVAMLGQTFKYVAPVAGALGFSIEDVAVATGLMANAGIKAEQAGTTLRAVFSRLVNPVGRSAEAVEELVLSMTNADGTMKSLSEIMVELRARFAELSESERASMAANLAGQEAMSGLLAIVNASEKDFASLTEQINSATGAAAEMSAVMQDNLQGDITTLKSALEALGIEVYESLQEPLRRAAQAATVAVNRLIKLFETPRRQAALEQLGNAISNLLTTIAELVEKVLPPLVEAFSWFVDNLGGIIPLWIGLATAIKTYKAAVDIAASGTGVLASVMQSLPLGPMAAVIGAVAAGVALLAISYTESRDPMEQYRADTAAITEELRKQREAIGANAEKRAEAVQSIKDEAAELKHMDARLRTLAANTNRTAGETAEMYALIDQLNAALPGLNQSYDEQTGLLKQAEVATYSLIRAKQAEAMAVAAQERMVEVSKDILANEQARAKAAKELETAQREQAAAQAELSRAQADWNARAGMGTGIGAQYATNLNNAKNAVNATTERVNALTGEMQLLDAQAGELSGEMDYLATTVSNAGGAAAKAADSMTAAADGAVEMSEAYAEAYAEADKLVESLFNLTDEVDTVDVSQRKAKKTVEELSESLQSQTGYMNQYADNMRIAAENGVDKGLLAKLSDGSVESAKILASLVQMSKDEIERLNATFQENEAGKQNLKESMAEIVAAGSDELNELPGEAESIGKNAGQGLADGILAKEEVVAAAAKRVADRAAEAMRKTLEVKSPSRVFRRIGGYVGEGFALGISDTEGMIVATVEEIGDAIADAMTESVEQKYKTVTALEKSELTRLYDELERLENQKVTNKNQAILKAEKKAINERIDLLEGLRKEYDRAYNDIINDQTKLEDKLKSFGNLFEKVEGAGGVEVFKLTNIEKDIDTLRRYGDALDELRKRGASPEFMEQFADMDADEGLGFASQLIALGETAFQKYMADWQTKQDVAAEIAKTFYADRLTELKDEFTDKITEQFSDASVDALAAGKATGAAYMRGIIESLDVAQIEAAVAQAQAAATAKAAGAAGQNVTNTTNNTTTTVDQTININQPVPSPAATSNAIKKASEDLINGG